MMFRVVLFLLAAVTAAPRAMAQGISLPHDEFVVESWGQAAGFNPFSVNAIRQTPDGYLWFATDVGLVRFDGTTFEYHEIRHPGTPSRDITAMGVDPRGRLWFGDWSGGVRRLDRRGPVFLARPGVAHGASEVYAIVPGAGGPMWLGGLRGLSRIEGDSVSRIAVGQEWAHTTVTAIADAPGGGLWLGIGKSLIEFNPADGTAVSRGRVPGASWITAILPDAGGGPVLGTIQGVYILRDGALTAVPGLEGAWVTGLCRDRSGSIWIATAETGVYRYDGGHLKHLTMADGLPGDRIRTVFEDREGTLWFGTRGTGFFRLKQSLVRMVATPSPGGTARISTVLETGHGNLLAGLKDNGLFLIDGHGARNVSNAPELRTAYVRATLEDSKGRLWLGTPTATYTLPPGWRNHPGARPTRVTVSGGDLISVRSIVEDSRGTIWLGSTGFGVFRQDPGDAAPRQAARLLDDYWTLIRVLRVRSDGSILAGSRGGLFMLRDTTVIVPESWAAAGISEVFSLLEDPDGTLWVGTYSQGLFRVRGDSVVHYTSADGLADDVVYSILDDGRGRLWISTNRGITCVGRDELNAFADGRIREVRTQTFDTHDGMRVNECNGGSDPSAWRRSDGALMFATMNGIAAIDPAGAGVNEIAPTVLLEDIVVDGRALVPDSGLELEPNTRTIDITYTSVGYRRSADTEFQAWLEGFDMGWVDRGTRRSIRYTSLPAGSYVLRVRSRFPGGAWQAEPSSFAFAVQPTVWERWPVRIGTVLLVVCAAIAAVRLRERKFKAEEARRRELRTTISELESRALRSQINPHFLFNSLNGIREAVLDNRMINAAEYIEQFAALMRNVLENSSRQAIPLEREVDTLHLYLGLEQRRFEQPFRYVLTVSPALAGASVMIPPMLVQPIVENAIWHGLSPLEGEKRLSISFDADGEYVRCVVEDNGVGRNGSATPGNGDRTTGNPRGVQITRGLIEAHRADGDRAGIDFQDLHASGNGARGTRVILTIPILP